VDNEGIKYRQLFLILHRWSGLICGLYLAMFGLSGSALVLAPYLYSWEYGVPATPVERRDAVYASPDIWLQKAQARYGPITDIEGYFGPLANPMRIAAPTITYAVNREGVAATGVIVVEPYTGEPLANFIADDSWAMLPLRLHMGLFLPYPLFWTVLTALGVLVLGMALSGLLIWWPVPGQWRRALSLQVPRSPRALGALHGAIGAVASPLLLVAALSGLLMSNQAIKDAVNTAFFGVRTTRTQNIEASCPGRPPVSAREALDVSRARLPHHELATLVPPADTESPFVVTLRPRGQVDPVRGNARVLVSSRCGDVRDVRLAQESGAGDILNDRTVDAHSGRMLGRSGEVLMFSAGLALGGLPLAGIALWFWRRRASRSVRQAVVDDRC
jgi:uncharacterized iron-regulated membrane protein